jgi:hypothetical protein
MPAVILLAEAGYSDQSSRAIVLYRMPSVVQDDRMFGSSSPSQTHRRPALASAVATAAPSGDR